MKKISFIFIYSFIAASVFPQDDRNYENLSSIPFRLGAETGSVVDLSGHDQVFYPAILGFFDINLYKRNYFLKFEGGIFGNLKDKNSAVMVSGGLNIKVFNLKKHKFYLHPAFFAAWNKTGGGASFFVSLRYLYPFNKIIAFVSSIRYPFGRFDAFFISAGFQLFAD